MKKLALLAVVVAALMLVFAATAGANGEPTPTVNGTAVLYAGQDTPMGTVEVRNDYANLYVTFNSTGDCMLETHVHVGTDLADIPQTKKNNPIPGQFEYSEPHGCVLTYKYTIPLPGGPGTELYIAAHAATGREEATTFVSGAGDTVFGPVNSSTQPAEWGEAGTAVRAYNWLGYTRDLSDPDQIPGCTQNPYNSLTWNWGFGLNPTYSPDIEGAMWISTAPNTEQWHVDSWRRFVKSFEVPGYPIDGTIEVNADNYYLVSNGETLGTDSDIFNGPETYTFYPAVGLNTLEFITRNLAQGSEYDYCAQLSNPNGVTYKGTVRYYADGETAWAGEMPFEGKNWATYFAYVVQAEPTCPTITGKSSNIDFLAEPPGDARVAALESDVKIRVWKEFEGTLTEDLAFDLDQGRAAKADGPPGYDLAIPAGTDVCVYYVHYDGLGAAYRWQTGWLEFSSDIAGLIISSGDIGTFGGRHLMFDADEQIGYPGTLYPPAEPITGVNFNRGFDVNHSINTDDAVFNGSRSDFTLWVAEANDSMRIILPLVP